MGAVVKLREVNGVIYASSRDVATDFEKRHDHVLETIKKLRSEMARHIGASWFRDDSYFDAYNRRKPCIDMTRQGWQLVVMNYEGMIAWKIAYILKFDEMEAKLGAGARTDALFDRKPKENVVAFQGPPRPQGELFAPSAPPANKGPQTKLDLFASQNPYATLDGVEDDLTASVSHAHMKFWSDTLEAKRAHHFRHDDGNEYIGRRLLRADGTLATYQIFKEPFNPTALREHALLPGTPKQFLLVKDITVPPLVAIELLNRECGIDSEIVAATIKHYMGG